MKNNQLITEGRMTDLAVVFYISKKLLTPYNKWAAFDLNIIDEKGKILKKRLETKEERNAFTILDKFVLRLRNLVGDSTFLKVASIGLLLMSNENKGNVIIENENNEQKLFRTIKEQILDLSSQITIPLESRNEELRIDYETNELKDKFNFLLGVFLNSEMVNGLGGNFLPLNDVNKEFLFNLNIIFNELDNGGNIKLKLIDDEQKEVKINVNYSSNEIKIFKDNDEESMRSSIITDFYIIFSKMKNRNDFINGWNKFYGRLNF